MGKPENLYKTYKGCCIDKSERGFALLAHPMLSDVKKQRQDPTKTAKKGDKAADHVLYCNLYSQHYK